MLATVTDMCCYDKERPDNKMLVRKPTMIKGTKEVVEAVTKRCDGTHEHSPIEGSIRCYDKAKRRKVTMNCSEWAGLYTAKFCKALLHGCKLARSLLLGDCQSKHKPMRAPPDG